MQNSLRTRSVEKLEEGAGTLHPVELDVMVPRLYNDTHERMGMEDYRDGNDQKQSFTHHLQKEGTEANATVDISLLPEEEEEAQQQQQQQQQVSSRLVIIGLACNVLSHFLIGTNPVMSRFLQTHGKMPSMSLTITTHILALVLYTPRTIHLIIRSILNRRKNRESNSSEASHLSSSNGSTSLVGRIGHFLASHWIFISFSLFCTLRVVSEAFAPKFTTATIVQLLTLTCPFMTAIIGSFLLKEKLSRATFIALMIMVTGGALVVLGGFNQARNSQEGYKFYWTIDFRALVANFSSWDLLGIALTMFSTLCLAGLIITVRAGSSSLGANTTDSEQNNNPENQRQGTGDRVRAVLAKYTRSYPPEIFFFSQIVFVPLALIIPSVILEDWSVYARLTTWDWVFFIFMTLTLILTQLNYVAIQILGAANASSTMAIRLVAVLLLSGPILGEWLNNLWQIVGALTVLMTVTSFLLIQKKQQQQQQPQEQQPSDDLRELDEAESIDQVTREKIVKDDEEEELEQV